MVQDFRLAVDFVDHPKTEKLSRKLGGDTAIRCLLRLWSFATQRRSKGVLSRMSIEDIEIAAGWTADPGELVKALCDVGYLEKHRNGEYKLHNWEKRNQWAFFSAERSSRARKAIKTRWAKRDNNLAHTGSNGSVIPTDTNSNTPSPSPSPSPEEEHARTSSPHARLQLWIKSEKGISWLKEQVGIYGRDFVKHELQKASQWVKDFPVRGNKKNWKRFLGHWFRRADESRSRKESEEDPDGLPPREQPPRSTSS